jgi:hypothetical protein
MRLNPSYEEILTAHVVTETARRSARASELFTQFAIQRTAGPDQILAIIDASSFAGARVSQCERHIREIIHPLEDAYAENSHVAVEELFSPQALTRHALELSAFTPTIRPMWGLEWDEICDAPVSWPRHGRSPIDPRPSASSGTPRR